MDMTNLSTILVPLNVSSFNPNQQFILVTSTTAIGSTSNDGTVTITEDPQHLVTEIELTDDSIDLRGHCIFCLELADATTSFNSNFQSLKDVWPYVSKWNGNIPDNTFVLGNSTGGTPIVSNVPPMCITCSREVEQIIIFHSEIVQLRNQLEILEREVEGVASRIQDKMKDTNPEMGYSGRLKKLMRDLSDNVPPLSIEKTVQFLDQLRGHVTSEEPEDHGITNKQNFLKRKSEPEPSSSSVKKAKASPLRNDVIFAQDQVISNSETGTPVDDEIYITQDSEQGKVILLVQTGEGYTPKEKGSCNNANPNNRGKDCEICGKEILIKNMYNHMRAHIGDYTFKCPNPKCEHAYLSRWSRKYYNHVLNRNGECAIAATGTPGVSVRKLKKVCETCGDEFDILYRFGLHLKRHESEEKNFVCPVGGCGREFTVRQSVEYHLHGDHNRFREKTVQTCHVCLEKIDPDEMGRHLEKHDLVTLQCKKCPLVFGERGSLLDHLVTHAKEGVECDICTSGPYYQGLGLREHYFLEHQVGVKYQCDWENCGYTAFTEVSIKTHKLRHHERRGSRSYKCDVCDPPAVYSCKTSLTSHNIRIHGAKPFTCQFCEETFTSQDSLGRHEKQHLGIPPKTYECKLCGKVFKASSKTAYDLHLLSHSAPDRKLKCKFCEKTFKREGSVRQHEKAEHLGIRHMCETCGKSFKDPQVLKHHLRIHSGERPYSCDICNLAFRQQGTWRTHVRSHHTKGDKFVPKGTFERNVDVKMNKEGHKFEDFGQLVLEQDLVT